MNIVRRQWRRLAVAFGVGAAGLALVALGGALDTRVLMALGFLVLVVNIGVAIHQWWQLRQSCHWLANQREAMEADLAAKLDLEAGLRAVMEERR